MTVNDVIAEVEAAVAPLRTERLLVEEIKRTATDSGCKMLASSNGSKHRGAKNCRGGNR
jgi:hypothetical protein